MKDPILNMMDDLIYHSYEHARNNSPEITPESWKNIFGPEADGFEARYQADKAIAKAMS